MYQRLLVPLDGSPAGDLGLKEAIRLASPIRATLVLIHVLDDFSVMMEMSSNRNFEDGRKTLKDVAHRMLDEAAKAVAQEGLACERILAEVKGEAIADVIVDQARQARCDLIVMGTHGRRGLSRLTMGSDAELVLRQTPVPVLLVKLP